MDPDFGARVVACKITLCGIKLVQERLARFYIVHLHERSNHRVEIGVVGHGLVMRSSQAVYEPAIVQP